MFNYFFGSDERGIDYLRYLHSKNKDLIALLNASSLWKKFNKKLKNKPIRIDAIIILINFTKNIWLK